MGNALEGERGRDDCIPASHGNSQAEIRSSPQHQKSHVGSEAEAHDRKSSEEDAHRARQAGREGREGETMIRKLPSGKYRLYSRKKNPKTGKRKNLGTFSSRAKAEQHERTVQFFKRR
jgi:hypothetical protein